MIRRSLSCDAFFFPLFVFVQPAEAYFRESRPLYKKLIKTVINIQASFATCQLKQIIPRKAKVAFPHYI